MVGAPPQAGYGEVTTKVMLPNSKIGAVIGKGGTVIKQIRDSSGAKVRERVRKAARTTDTPRPRDIMPIEMNLSRTRHDALNEEPPHATRRHHRVTRRHHPPAWAASRTTDDGRRDQVNISETIAGNTERVIAITGDYTQVHTAFTMMLQNMVSQPGSPSQQITDPLTGQVISVQEQPSFTLLVPQSKAGGLIGKAGATINQIRTASGASVKVGNSNDLSPGPGMERSVTVSGPLEGCLQARLPSSFFLSSL
jgi:predicted RNA-binding protein YlqC (UPF0109 family)